MLKNILLLMSLSAFLASLHGTAWAYFLDAPHNQANGINCLTCHNNMNHVPDPADPDDTVYNYLCKSCHRVGGVVIGTTLYEAPVMGNHTDQEMNGVAPGDSRFTNQCIDCHNPHFQGQYDWLYGEYSKLFLVNGNLDAPLNYLYEAANPALGLPIRTTFSFMGGLFVNNQKFADPTKWAVKGGYADPTSASDGSRGLLFVPRPSSTSEIFEIIAATGTADGGGTITVKGLVPTSMVGEFDDFGIIYGQSIKSVMYDANGYGSKNIKFFAPLLESGMAGLGDASTTNKPTGLCQVCHPASIGHWNTDNSGDKHHGASDCADCHLHDQGFKADRPHPEKTGTTCESCHDQTGTADLIIDIHNGNCNNCHNADKTLRAGTNGDATLHVFGVTSTCLTCHPTRAANYGNHTADTHTTTVIATSDSTCEDCHTGDIKTVIHKNICSRCHVSVTGILTGSAINHTVGSPSNCAGCHIDRVNGHLSEHNNTAFEDSPTKETYPPIFNQCVNCHADFAAPYLAEAHMALPATATYPSGMGCDGCHNYNGTNLNKYSVSAIIASAKTDNPVSVASCADCHGPYIPAVIHQADFVWDGNCDTCHTGANIAKDLHKVCTNCHLTAAGGSGTTKIGDSFNGVDGDATLAANADLTTTGCATCHGVATTTTITDAHHIKSLHNYAINGNCTVCHSDIVHDSMVQNSVNCADCHAPDGSLVYWTYFEPVAHTCTSCHTSDGSLVEASEIAPLMPQTGGVCEACHGDYFDRHGHHNSESNQVVYDPYYYDPYNPYPPTCADCHNDTGNNLAEFNDILIEHDVRDGVRDGQGACRNCHAYSGDGSAFLPDVQSAINNHQYTLISCTDCHVAIHEPNPNSFYHPWFDWDGNCAECHFDPNSNNEVITDVHRNNCFTCHQQDPNFFYEVGATKAGYPANGVDGDASPPANGDPYPYPYACSSCHGVATTTTIPDAHHLASANNYAQKGECTVCHPNYEHNQTVQQSGFCSTCHNELPVGNAPPTVQQLPTVPPNIMFIVDDSGSMGMEYLYADPYESLTDPKTNSDRWKSQWSVYNLVFYNPQNTYTYWPTVDGMAQTLNNANPDTPRLHPWQTATYNLNATFLARTDVNGWTVNILNGHYYTWDDLDGDEIWDDANYNGVWNSGQDENIYLVNLTNPITYFQFRDLNGDNRVGNGELTPVSVWNLPATVKTFSGQNSDYYAERQNFANWYQYGRSRHLVSVGALANTIVNMQGAYVGLYAINATLKNGSARLILPVREVKLNGFDRTSELLTGLYSYISEQTTPLRMALQTVGRYFDTSDYDNTIGPSPIMEPTQQNFAILVTDGYWNDQNTVNVGNVDGNFGPPYADPYPDTLADVAMYYYTRDLAPFMYDMVPPLTNDSLENQHLNFSAISLGVTGTIDPSNYPDVYNNPPNWPQPTMNSSTTIDDLWHATINGRGKFSTVINPNYMSMALGEIVAVTGTYIQPTPYIPAIHSQCSICHNLDGSLVSGNIKAPLMPKTGGPLPDDGGGMCEDCHGYAFSTYPHDLQDKHPTALTKAGTSCEICHDPTGTADIVADIHKNTCVGSCHDTGMGLRSGANGDAGLHQIGGISTCNTCHPDRTANFYNHLPPPHDNVISTTDNTCETCHPTANSVVADSHSDNCDLCHQMGNGILQYSATNHTIGTPSDCVDCHISSFVNIHMAMQQLTFDTIRNLNTQENAITTDLNLVTTLAGATISWVSSDYGVITSVGVVSRPAHGSGNAPVTLTATISDGPYSDFKIFNVTVLEEINPYSLIYSGSGYGIQHVFTSATDTADFQFTYDVILGNATRDVYFIFTNTNTTDNTTYPVVTEIAEPPLLEAAALPASMPPAPPQANAKLKKPTPHERMTLARAAAKTLAAWGRSHGKGVEGRPDVGLFNQDPEAYLAELAPPKAEISGSATPEPEPTPLADTVGSGTTFYNDYSQIEAINATCRKVVTINSKTLNIWVENASWTTTCTKTNCVNQTMVDRMADKFLSSGTDNVYTLVTNVFGAEWGADAEVLKSNQIPADDNITILLFDIDNDNSTSGGITGFYWAKDNYKKSVLPGSNARIMFYIDSVLYATPTGPTWNDTDFWPLYMFGTLAHEFQHMIHYYQKYIKFSASSEVWLDEMAADFAKDMVASKLGTESPRGVSYNDGTAGAAYNTNGRLPRYCRFDYNPVTQWMSGTTADPGDTNVLNSYSLSYSLGAYLARNYGGTAFFRYLVQNQFSDTQAINLALFATGYGKEDFNSILQKWAVATLLSDDSTNTVPAGYRYNTGNFINSTLGSITYELGSINMFNYHYNGLNGPQIYTSLPPADTMAGRYQTSNMIYRVGTNLTGTVVKNITLRKGEKLTVVVK